MTIREKSVAMNIGTSYSVPQNILWYIVFRCVDATLSEAKVPLHPTVPCVYLSGSTNQIFKNVLANISKIFPVSVYST